MGLGGCFVCKTNTTAYFNGVIILLSTISPDNLQIETIFKGNACTEIREAAIGFTKQLAQTANETFGDFEEAIEKEATETAVTDGTVHPLTSYVVKFLFE